MRQDCKWEKGCEQGLRGSLAILASFALFSCDSSSSAKSDDSTAPRDEASASTHLSPTNEQNPGTELDHSGANESGPGAHTSTSSSTDGALTDATNEPRDVQFGSGEFDEGCMLRTSNHAPGDRIVLRNAVTAEGDKAFVGFYDQEKQAECEVVQDARGDFRCMPKARDKDTENRYFLDERCEEEVEYRGICALDHQAVRVSDDACDQRRRLFAFGESLPAATVYERDADGNCREYGNLGSLYAMGPELVPEEYAKVEPVTWRGKGRIWAQGYEGDGGLRIVEHLLDSHLEQRCVFEQLSAKKEHCVPETEGLLGFTDPTCQQILLASEAWCGEPAPKYVSSSTSAGQCAASKSYLKATTPYEDERYLASSCTLAMNQTSPVFFTELVSDDEFVAVESTTAPADGGRLEPRYRTTTDGGCFFQDFWDNELQTACSFVPYGEQYYCLPLLHDEGALVAAFTDAACSEASPFLALRACEAATPPRFAVVDVPSCVAGPRKVRPVNPTPVSLPAALWIESGSDCIPYAPQPDTTYFAVGDEMSNGSFVAAVLEP